ncbi:MAG: hypothetical protein A2Y14_00820 [Verrucomicrobia bacterium GWF2_51_19]|nr:MAG: hypothetical protein A2Y14_00820 [Verrucomicrobia bacterium GWF2_51_19]HAD82591.1 ABC transporter permease [Candidatus Edwardsbacteria bacterium]
MHYLLIAASALLFGCKKDIDVAASALRQKTVAITQIVAHPSLDNMRRGVHDGLQARGFSPGNVRFIETNAQGNLSIALQIAQQVKTLQPDVVVAITTPSAQTIRQINPQGTMLFAGISDPVSAGLLPDDKHPNVGGVYVEQPIGDQLDLIQRVLPHVKRIGVLLNAGESNSVATLEQLQGQAGGRGLIVITSSVTNTAAITQALEALSPKIDILFLLQDNTVASALPLVLKICSQHKMPTFATFPEAVEQGALIALACSDYDVGKRVGEMAADILSGASPTPHIEKFSHFHTHTNPQTAALLGITLP